MEIRYVNYAIANNFGSYIELNEGLKAYPALHAAILKHELEHTNEPGFTSKDLMLDLEQAHFGYWDLFKFMINNPKSFMQLLPFYKKQGTVFYDINMIIVWCTLFTVVAVGLFVGLKL